MFTMRLSSLTLSLSFAVLSTSPAFASNAGAAVNPETVIKQLIAEGYCNGAFNALDTAAMARAFHPEFAILGNDGEKLERFAIKDWLAAIETRKKKPDFDPKSTERACRVTQVDWTGNVAAAKVEIDKAGLRQYTDYLSLVRFPSGWKIVSKVYFDHLQK
jgi:hypothetical protein